MDKIQAMKQPLPLEDHMAMTPFGSDVIWYVKVPAIIRVLSQYTDSYNVEYGQPQQVPGTGGLFVELSKGKWITWRDWADMRESGILGGDSKSDDLPILIGKEGGSGLKYSDPQISVTCKITAVIDGKKYQVENVGVAGLPSLGGNMGERQGVQLKAVYTDALKRTAMNGLGIGGYLYEMPKGIKTYEQLAAWLKKRYGTENKEQPDVLTAKKEAILLTVKRFNVSEAQAKEYLVHAVRESNEPFSPDMIESYMECIEDLRKNGSQSA